MRKTNDKLESSLSSPTKKEAKGRSPLKKMAKSKKGACGEMFEKITAAQQASDERFPAIEE